MHRPVRLLALLGAVARDGADLLALPALEHALGAAAALEARAAVDGADVEVHPSLEVGELDVDGDEALRGGDEVDRARDGEGLDREVARAVLEVEAHHGDAVPLHEQADLLEREVLQALVHGLEHDRQRAHVRRHRHLQRVGAHRHLADANADLVREMRLQERHRPVRERGLHLRGGVGLPGVREDVRGELLGAGDLHFFAVKKIKKRSSRRVRC